MEGDAPKTVEEVFKDFKGRRAGVIKALTSDVESFYRLCDPEKDNLCLYGLPNETWEVNLPVEEVPPEIPEPALGINFARDGMQEKDWLSLVAVHSDSWLLAVAFYFGSRFSFGRSDRKRLFEMMNELPTVFEITTGNAKHPPENHNGTSRIKSSTKVNTCLLSCFFLPPNIYVNSAFCFMFLEPHQPENHNKSVKASALKEEDSDEEEEEEEDEGHGEEQGGTLCGACGDDYGPDEFWICCDICEKWFHGKCVKITPAKAEHMKQYKCPGCTNKRPRVV